MKMISSTSITSTSGVTLISDRVVAVAVRSRIAIDMLALPPAAV